jgi:chromate transporter
MPERSVRTDASPSRFLKDVLICSLGAYGGPETHIGVFMNQLVEKQKYLTEQELVELLALCNMLPGPSSTQTIVAVGYRRGGPTLALLTLLVWALPAVVLMTAASFAYAFLESRGITDGILRFIGPVAIGFIIYAATRIGVKVLYDGMTEVLFVASAAITYFVRDPWIFPAVLILGGTVSIVVNREDGMWTPVRIRPPWVYLAVFAGLAVGALVATAFTDNPMIELFESFYRFGYLVLGGGQVVVPVMQTELVEVRGYITNQEFLAGYGLVQGLPGPMFSFASFVGGMVARGSGAGGQIMAAVIAAVGIFMPGLLLIYFVYPIWNDVREIRAIRLALQGVNAVAGGLIAVSAAVLAPAVGLTPLNLGIAAGTSTILFTRKIPAPLIVLAALVLGLIA